MIPRSFLRHALLGALIVRDNAADNKGNFGVCSGVCSFFGGGTFLTINEFSEHKEAALKKFYTAVLTQCPELPPR